MTQTTKQGRGRSSLLLAICLLAGLYVMVGLLVLLGASLFLPVILALGGHVNTAVLIGAEFVAVGSIPGLMLIYYCVFTLRRAPDGYPAIDVAPGDAPELWEAVDAVAAAIRTRPPTRLRVAALANATVFEETRLLGFAVGQRCLTIGLPLLLGTTEAELRAVLAHELGHYAGGHTRLGAQVYRGSVALRNSCQALRAAREPGSHRSAIRVLWRLRSLYAYVAFGVFAAYSALYDRVSFAARRRQELQADAFAAQLYGRAVMADALRAAHALPVAWSRFQNGFLEPMRKAGYLPDDPFSAFEAMLCDPDYRDVLAELRVSPAERPVSRLDSHPTLTQRLAALTTVAAPVMSPGAAVPARADGPAGADGLARADGPAAELLSCDERQSVGRRLHREMFSARLADRLAERRELSWQEWVSTAAALRATAPAAGLVGVASRLTGGSAATLATVLDLLAAGQGSELAAALAEDRGEVPDIAPAMLAAALYALTGHYLVETRRAEWAVSWTGPSRLIAADIGADKLTDLVGAAIHRPATEVARLRLHLASLRLDPAASAPVDSLLKARTHGLTDLGRVGIGPTSTVRIVTGADLVTTQRLSTIRTLNIAVGIVTGIVALLGLHAWSSSHTPPPLTIANPPFTGATPPVVVPNPVPSTLPGVTLPSPLPLPPLSSTGLLKLRPVMSITVQAGDSLSALACRYETTVRALQRMNRLGSSTLIVPGQHLAVPLNFGITGTC